MSGQRIAIKLIVRGKKVCFQRQRQKKFIMWKANESVSQNLFRRFKEGNTNLDTKKMSGISFVFDEPFLEMVEQQPRIGIGTLPAESAPSLCTITRTDPDFWTDAVLNFLMNWSMNMIWEHLKTTDLKSSRFLFWASNWNQGWRISFPNPNNRNQWGFVLPTFQSLLSNNGWFEETFLFGGTSKGCCRRLSYYEDWPLVSTPAASAFFVSENC